MIDLTRAEKARATGDMTPLVPPMPRTPDHTSSSSTSNSGVIAGKKVGRLEKVQKMGKTKKINKVKKAEKENTGSQPVPSAEKTSRSQACTHRAVMCPRCASIWLGRTFSAGAADSTMDAQSLCCMRCLQRHSLKNLLRTSGKTKYADILRPLQTISADVPTEDQLSAVCLFCRFKAMDPFNEVVEPVLKCVLSGRHGAFNFALSLPQLDEWRDAGDNVEIRMLEIDAPRVRQAWPLQLTCHANRTKVFTVDPPWQGHTRRDMPQKVTPALQPGDNAISVEMTSEHKNTSYALAVVHTTPRRISELTAQVVPCGEASGRRRICELLARRKPLCDSDDITCLSSDKLSLVCPISLARVTKPSRGKHCQHLQCFDLETFLASNHRMAAFNNRWNCPVCSLLLCPSDLVVDSYVESMLSATTEDIMETVVRPDGSWSVVEPPVTFDCGSPSTLEDCSFEESSMQDVTDNMRMKAVSKLCLVIEEALRKSPPPTSTGAALGALALPKAHVQEEVCAILQQLQMIRQAGVIGHADTAVDALRELELLPVSVSCLKTTKIAAELNHPSWRDTTVPPEARERAASLVRRWRVMFRAEGEGNLADSTHELTRKSRNVARDLEESCYDHSQRHGLYEEVISEVAEALMADQEAARGLVSGTVTSKERLQMAAKRIQHQKEQKVKRRKLQ
eukprot:gnl/TRDRNA2_/TRDRNA2_191598_c0_seq1.p1 gnl/TRDRNA2_/TRDRNA2_191598_c0~~gnl/TRDRNA2_/TRDRNA2_191598_c0_seq1.p1  ORF type:complete len:680 (+),score=117.52 gnl/TRDRNA2_/TRDRNA2_191598_c0_seq1:141-2180(+)